MKRLILIFVLCGLFLPSAYGEWANDRFSNGDTYVGEVQNRKQHGQGTYTWADGRKYVGEFSNGVFHGHGTHTYRSGNKYVGEWKNGLRHGDGVGYEKSGRIVGEWKMDHPWNAVGISTSGDFMGKYVNGAPQQQNQGLNQSQLMELLLLVNLLKRDNNASQQAIDWERIFGGGGFTCKTNHYWSGSFGDSTTRCR